MVMVMMMWLTVPSSSMQMKEKSRFILDQLKPIGRPPDVTILGVSGALLGDDVAAGNQLVQQPGDLTDDDQDDLVLSGWRADEVVDGVSVTDAGVVYIIEGPLSSGTTLDMDNPSDYSSKMTGTETYFAFGSKVEMGGDLNGDGSNIWWLHLQAE